MDILVLFIMVRGIKMDRNIAVSIIYELINSDILKEDLEESLIEIANSIESDDWDGEIELPLKGRGV